MPSPAFYDRMWQAANSPPHLLPLSPSEEERGEKAPTARGVAPGAKPQAVAPAFTQAAADLIVEIARLTRERNFPVAVSTPDAIAAVQMARQLAALRGHPWPLREDVLDGVRSSFVKGELGADGRVLLQLVHEKLAGNRVGQVPPGVGVPPIVHDFHQEARRLRLPIDSVERKELTLDLYRKTQHREVSRLLHRLGLLDTPFAVFLGGPDFVHGQGLELMQEHWQVCWSPATESALIEASVYGPTVAEAAAARLRQLIAGLEDAGQGRSTAAAVAMLVRACRMGLHEQAAEMTRLIDVHIAEDPSFPSVVGGLSQLELLAHSREPLEATHLTDLPRLTDAAYQRACRLAGDLATCPDEMVNPALESLRTLREVLAAQRHDAVLASVEGKPAGFTPAARQQNAPAPDADLFHAALRRVVGHTPSEAQAAVVGAAAGVLYGEGEMSEAELIRVARGYLGGTAADPKKSCGVLRGLFATAREVAWQVTEIARALDAQMGAWDEKTFLEALPELRLAFADLTPGEIAQVADHVAGLHGKTSLGSLVHTDLDEGEVHLGLTINQLVRETLAADRLHREEADTPGQPDAREGCS